MTSLGSSRPEKLTAIRQTSFPDEDSTKFSLPVITRSSFFAAILTVPIVAFAEPNNYDDRSTNSSLFNRETTQESISGAISGSALSVFKAVVKYPLDTATVRLQMPDSRYSLRNPRDLLQDSYRGALIPVLANIPAGATFFGTKDAFKAILKQQQPGMSKWLSTAIAVAVAQVPYWIVRNPSEVVKTRQQSGVAGFQGLSTLQAYQTIYNETKSVKSFYTGYVENILYAYPADFLKFGLYEALTSGQKSSSPVEGAVAGAVSTALAQFITTPLDVVRNRIMVKGIATNEAIELDTTGVATPSPSYVDTLLRIRREEGWSGLFAGSVPRVGKALVSGAVQFATYEESKQKLLLLLRQRNSQ